MDVESDSTCDECSGLMPQAYEDDAGNHYCAKCAGVVETHMLTENRATSTPARWMMKYPPYAAAGQAEKMNDTAYIESVRQAVLRLKSDSRPLDDIEMSIRCWNCLNKEWGSWDRWPYPAKLVTLGDLRLVPLDYFIVNVRCCGTKTLKEIAEIRSYENNPCHPPPPAAG